MFAEAERKKNLLKTAEVSANLVKMAENLINW